MKRGLLLFSLSLLLVGTGGAIGVTTPINPNSSDILVKTSEMEFILPPGASVASSRGSLEVEKGTIVNRKRSDGILVRTLPVRFTWSNHWQETFIFDGFNEAVLTDGVGDKHFAGTVYRENSRLEPGVSGLIPPGHKIAFTLLYDLDEWCVAEALNEVKLDLRYLNHGHPYLLSAMLVSGEPGVEERPRIVEQVPPPRPIVEQSAPAPVPPKPVVVPPRVAPPQVVTKPLPPPAVYVPPPVVAPPPRIVEAPPVPVRQSSPLPVSAPSCCSPCSCQPCAPYLVTVSYEPIQPQPGECTYCTCLPYGCPDGAPCASCPPGGGGGACGGGGCCGMGGLLGCDSGCGCGDCGLFGLGGILSIPGNILCGVTSFAGSILNCALSTVGGLEQLKV